MLQVFEKYPGFKPNTIAKNTTVYGSRIPDFVNKAVVGEIKNVRYQTLTRQIKGMMQIATSTDRKFILVIKNGTKLSKPLQKAIRGAGAKIIKYGSRGVSCTFEILPWGTIEKLAQFDPRTGKFKNERQNY